VFGRVIELFLNGLDFYNWNRIKIRYCDGSSFTGDVEAVDPVSYLKFPRNLKDFLIV